MECDWVAKCQEEPGTRQIQLPYFIWNDAASWISVLPYSSLNCVPFLLLSHLHLFSTPHLPRRFTRRRFLWRWITIKRRSSSVLEERCRWRWVSAVSPCFQSHVFPFKHYEDNITSRQRIEMCHRNDKSLMLLMSSGHSDIEESYSEDLSVKVVRF